MDRSDITWMNKTRNKWNVRSRSRSFDFASVSNEITFPKSDNGSNCFTRFYTNFWFNAAYETIAVTKSVWQNNNIMNNLGSTSWDTKLARKCNVLYREITNV